MHGLSTKASLLVAALGVHSGWLPRAVAEEVTIPKAALQGQAGVAAGSGRFFLLTVGVGKYADDFWPALQWTTEDTRRVGESFGEATGLTLVRRTLTDAGATRKAMLTAMGAIRAEVTARDTVVVYLSGHGTLAETDDGDLAKVVVLHDTRQDQLMTSGLLQRDLVDWLDSLAARRRLLIFATCHGGVGKSRLPARVGRLIQSAKGRVAPLEEVSEGSLILAAAARGEAAREDDRLKGDIYTHYLLEGLTTYDRNRDGVVTALEAHDYAKERTYAHSKGRQRPTAEARLIGAADVPLRGARQRRGVPVLEAYDEAYAGFQLKVGDGEKGRLPLALPLSEGASHVTLYGPGEGKQLAEFRVKAQAGETVTLDDVLAPAPFGVAIDLGQETWRDSRLAKLTGKSTMVTLDLGVSYHWHAWLATLRMGGPNGADRELSRGLDVTLERQKFGLAVGHLFQLRPATRLSAALTLARESVSLEFSDQSDDQLAYESEALLYGIESGIEQELKHGLSLGLTFGYMDGTHDFGDIGALGAERLYGALRFLSRFGGVARRL